ncbi:MAG: hypothetical protein D3926_09610 [Desulfobacteraceae bacterium]|nr:MAG: hypothetical protein D3926_09610 [Desulfobacteraceae bacterium]
MRIHIFKVLSMAALLLLFTNGVQADWAMRIGSSGTSFYYDTGAPKVYTPPYGPLARTRPDVSIRPDHPWDGYPYRMRPYRLHWPVKREKETVIIREKEVIREVPVIIERPAPEPQKTWVPPVVEEKVIPGHYTHGIRSFVDEDGILNFVDDNTRSVWIPEHTVQVVRQEGYWVTETD